MIQHKKLHQGLCDAVVRGLHEVLANGRYADKVVAGLLRENPRWGSRDRAFIANSIYEVIRWKRRLGFWVEVPEEDASEASIRKMLLALLWSEGYVLPTWEKWILEENYLAKRQNLITLQDLSIRESYPVWLSERIQSQLGDNWPEMARILNLQAPLTVRVNTLKAKKVDISSKMPDWEPESLALAPDALILRHRGNLFSTEWFKKGFIEVQDAGSQTIAPFLGVAPGMRVVDACAGAGGKTLHFAALMENKGMLIALDTEAWKLEELKRRARRNGVNIHETRPIVNNKTIKRLYNSADRLLLDVPCSGTGVLKRNPDAKWKLTNEKLDQLLITQAQILKSYANMVKPGGRLVYATCSILPEENENQVARFLAEAGENYRLIEEKHISPLINKDADGFYMALIERIN